MADISIKLKIGDREYPMRVDAAEEEAIRRASKELNEQLKNYQSRFQIEDRQDLLAMVAFDCWMRNFRTDKAKSELESQLDLRLKDWDSQLSSALLEE